MTPVSRCYPMAPRTRFVALAMTATSPVPEVGVPAMTAFIEAFRPRVTGYVIPLHDGLRPPLLTVTAYTEHALVGIAACLDRCPATDDDALHAWAAAETTRTVIDLHRSLREAVRARRRRRPDSGQSRAA